MIFSTIVLATERIAFSHELHGVLLDRGIHILPVSWKEKVLCDLLDAAPDLIILDCDAEGVNRLALCQTIRKNYDGPVVLLSSPQQEEFCLLALQLGADIVLPATGSTRLLAENITALLSRLTTSSISVLQCGELTIDASQQEAFLENRSLKLSTIEFRLLWLLCKKAGQPVSRETIHRQLYDAPYNGYDRSIDLYISRIRQKIGDSPSSPVYLKTVRGVGYQFVPQNRDAISCESHAHPEQM